MSSKHTTLTLLLATIAAVACDAGPPEPDDRFAVVASERGEGVSLFAFEAADASADGCAVVVLDQIDSAIVLGEDDVVAVCDATCEAESAGDEATERACGHAPDVVADYARALAQDDVEFRDWCPPEEPACDPGVGYGCLAPACKSACGREFRQCSNACAGDIACRNACAEEAQICFPSCC